jgi:hypothetical protein
MNFGVRKFQLEGCLNFCLCREVFVRTCRKFFVFPTQVKYTGKKYTAFIYLNGDQH